MDVIDIVSMNGGNEVDDRLCLLVCSIGVSACLYKRGVGVIWWARARAQGQKDGRRIK
jgi:hypothetical protein